MTFWNLVSVAGAVIAIASVAGLALQRGITVSLREQLDDADKEAARLAKKRAEERAEDAATIIALTGTVNSLRSDLTALQRVVTGEVHWQAISDLLEHHHATAERHWKRDEEILEEIRDEMKSQAS